MSMTIFYEDINTYEKFTDLLTCQEASSIIRANVDTIAKLIPEVKDMEGFDQMSIYHNLDVLEHTLKVLDGIPCDMDGKRDAVLAYSAFFHDIAKPACFYIDPADGHGHMDGHPEAGEVVFRNFAERINFPADAAKVISKLIIYHDTYVEQTPEEVTKMVELMTPPLMDKLQILQRADVLAHSPRGLSRLTKLEKIIQIRQNI